MTEPELADATADEPREPQLTLARILLGLLVALVVGVVVVVTIGNKAGFANLTETLKGGDIGWLAICAIGQVVVFAGYAGALRRAIAFEGGPRIETGLTLRVVLASFALSQLFAAGGVAGLAVTYWALRRVGMDRRAAAVRLIGLSTAVYLVFGVIGWVAALLALVLNVGAARDDSSVVGGDPGRSARRPLVHRVRIASSVGPQRAVASSARPSPPA